MPIRRFHSLLDIFLALSLLAATVLGLAASPHVLHRAHAQDLPNTPAYKTRTIQRELKLIDGSNTPHVVNVVVDSPARIAQLSKYAANVSNPKSPLYHHFLSPAEVDVLFGPTPDMIRQAESRMRESGWRVTGREGFIVRATIPESSRDPGIPVSDDIWSITGLAPHGLIRNPISTHGAADASTTTSLAAEKFNEPPNVIQQTTAANGDVVSIMSWNSLAATQVPAGLPINLFVTVQDPQGNFLPIDNVTNLNDAFRSLISFGPSAMPDSSNTLWQVPIAAFKDVAQDDPLSLQVVLPSGDSLNASFRLPAFTGAATVLTALDAQQLNTLSGMKVVPSNPGPIALFAIGSPPSLSDLALYLGQNTNGATGLPQVTFKYEDGAFAKEYGQQADSEESQLDIEAAAGAAPGAPISDYVFPENDNNDPLISFLTELSQQSTCKVASLSYGFFGEDENTLSVLMNTLTAEGVTVIEASGDQGAWNGGNDPGPIGLSSLEQVPSVLSVGGADIAAPAKTDANGNTTAITGPIISDAWGGDFLNGIPVAVAQAYTHANAASSGGYSTITPIPAWQSSFLPASASGFGVPIISSLAGYPGLSGYLQGQNVIFGGTSLAAPLTAGWLSETEAALDFTNEGMGNINPLIFQAATSDPAIFNQALWGQDGYYTVTASQSGSWNPLTGLGMMNWGQLLNDYSNLVPNAPATAILTSDLSTTVGKSDIITAYDQGLTNPLFQFSYRSPQNGLWTTSGPFSPSDTLNFKAKVPGAYIVRVQAKDAAKITAPSQITIMATTKAPMVSSLSIKTFPEATILDSKSTYAIQAYATDTGTLPQYQFWVSGTNVARHIARGWSSSGRFSLSHLKPGRYAITVDALDRAEVMHHNWAAAYRDAVMLTVK